MSDHGNTCFVVATGTSLDGFDFSLLAPYGIVAVNGAGWFVPEGVLVSLHYDVEKIFTFKFGHIHNCSRLVTGFEIPDIMTRQGGIPLDSGVIGVALALDCGCSPVYLLGFDGYSINGRDHFYDPEPDAGQEGTTEMPAVKFYDRMYAGMKGKEVYNLNLNSLLEVFPKTEFKFHEGGK